MSQKGKLYLIPTPLGEDAVETIPSYVIEILHSLEFFIAERAKTARHFIKTTHPQKAFSELSFTELNKRTTPQEIQTFLDPIFEGKDIGLLSEAGCPGVADPGGVIVQMAHQREIEVIPLVGPSSILLALMASGMNGQSFAFQGYLSAKKPELARDLKRLEQLALKQKQTQIFIETPYRNGQLIETALSTLSSNTRFCVAANLTLPTQYIRTQRIQKWRKTSLPDLHKKPTIFLIF
ncbi:SAM-dependent methyltransferase [Saprospiraceae bacterium]|jgi:16S rRNA (cytidine1402-2'-O)-methyltransferase|nr:SAM-dependent methyltransferase [Bacteroidota bacterium]MDB4727344.1 SAM-dependent methyltransferase [Saprospiraceae bacterium]MDF1864008.1 SAM-dependent methyltransferase [Saprospiraceae bacterium]